MALTWLHRNWQNGSYQADRDLGLKLSENSDLYYGRNLSGLRPHRDSNPNKNPKWSIAIGYGYDLLKNSVLTIKSDLAKINVTLSAADETLLNDYHNGTKTKDDVINGLTLQLPSEAAASTLLGFVVSSFETQLDNRLGYTMPESKERAALVSMVYNGGAGIIGPKLTAAIANDNRAEAWFEIRYNSNADRSHASRRYTESNMFNLYNSAFDEAGAKEVMRMAKQSVFSNQLSA